MNQGAIPLIVYHFTGSAHYIIKYAGFGYVIFGLNTANVMLSPLK